MTTWLDLEARFRDCAKKLPNLRLDIQSGAAGEYLNLTGDSRGTDYRNLLSLITICGRLLERSLPKGSPIIEEKDHVVRWYRLLKDISGAYEPEMPGMMRNADGSSAGMIYVGRILRFCEESATLCMRLEADYPIRDERVFLRRLYDDYGKEIVIGVILAILTAIIGLFFGK